MQQNPSPSPPGEEFDRLVHIMSLLRGPNGCPWDRKQTFQSLKPYLLEEAYEVLDSIDAEDWNALSEELGDLILQPIFLAQMASEDGFFSIADSLRALNDKLVRRHPHVFGDAKADTPDEVKQRWELIKKEEKRQQGREQTQLLDGISRSQPALAEAQQIGSKVAGVGFDWPDVESILAKLDEELNELQQARRKASHEEIEQELGDLLFVITNLARRLNVDSEQALRGANRKFRKRFAHVERRLAEQGIQAATLGQMEAMWQEAKQNP
ncbi:MAG: nucleoside triphosphate pyrophosphohydrolase [Acidimicrobiia bacterium]|nr:nucleoside triphosphate pyrophosphohydrolase [Acidimicrobiia bacterium]